MITVNNSYIKCFNFKIFLVMGSGLFDMLKSCLPCLPCLPCAPFIIATLTAGIL